MTEGTRQYRSWGRPDAALSRAFRPRWRDFELPGDEGRVLPFGNGRSYGDSCLNPGGSVIDMRGLDRFISFDTETGVLACEAGVLLDEILRVIVPRGWFLPVTPGTRFVTLGGAIANDVHGKNHHLAGSFGHHLRRFELLRSDGTRRICSADENADWFAATIGGLGLTGLITWAEIALKPVHGPAIETEVEQFTDLDRFLELSDAAHDDFEYTAAWIDSTRPDPGDMRGLFFRGNHAPAGTPAPAAPRPLPGPPFTPPFSMVPSLVVRPFNFLTYAKPRAPRGIAHYEPFFYPLDRVANWNRLFGRRGFFQHQSVVPRAVAREAVGALIGKVAGTNSGSTLSVLKVFGDATPRGLLSFPRPGVTLALDIPDRGARSLELMADLDRVVMEAGGAIYPAKDARMDPAVFRQGFPRWQEFETYRDPGFSSGFWRRVMEENL
ncbi:FAD-binding oxidoreductase [Paracoccus alkanivorans]|uniref:FAD-binding oxidoreductase n=1 Tax=Paracoccus alkanivorans TaxID=2116655 RepID=A0A3M0M7Q7_9RHOB|nr:FAD-binding oxidoreductase [Paracoccus alkanivorans]RMC33659.1 FAD-binding oxidoreductase [Paracoccus alkanivorans]